MVLDWSDIEIDLIIVDYFTMLNLELSGKYYNKAERRRRLRTLLNNRTEGSIEFKHQNISAILARLGQPFIKGYLPRYNYQRILEDKVINYLTEHLDIEEVFQSFAEKSIKRSNIINFESVLVDPPKFSQINEPEAQYQKSNPFKVNYLEKEQGNRKLGDLGEEFVLSYEKWRLRVQGKGNYADDVRWISKEVGDGSGFDILSRETSGEEKYIEVKTTKLSKETPIYFSLNELQFSRNHSTKYHVFRLFNFEKGPKMFIKSGAIDTICHYYPINYKGFF